MGEGQIEVDESYFGAKLYEVKEVEGASGKLPVFGMLQRGGKVYTQIVNNCSMNALVPIMEKYASKESVIYSDGWKAYDGLADFGYKKHYRVKHGQNEFANGSNHMNGIENFWGFVK